MPKLTLLEMTQDILSDMDSDEVNSINDTPDSLQVVQIIKSTFYDIIDGKSTWPHLRTLLALDASGDTDIPTHMKLPTNIKSLELLKYNKVKAGETRTRWEDIQFLYPDEFLKKVASYNIDNANVQEVTDPSGVVFSIKNDVGPSYWTSFDDEWIVFNSFDSDVESALQQSKTQCVAYTTPSWTMDDSFTPDLPVEAFSRLLAESKTICFARLKQLADATSAGQSTRQRWAMSRSNRQTGERVRMPNYGRRSSK